jgi:hypothetical protein
MGQVGGGTDLAGGAGARGAGGNTPGTGTDGGGAGGGASSPLGAENERNLEDERRAANLALRELQDQLNRGAVDENLKRQLGVNDADLQEFLRRMQERMSEPGTDESPEARFRRRQFEEMLRGIEYGSTGGTREAASTPGETTRGAGGVRRPTPPEYRDQERAFREQQTRPQP